MNQLFALLIFFLSFSALAASHVNYLNIDGDAVHFSLTEEKSHTLPSCVVAETNQRYGVSLLTESGRAMYSLLITATASKQAISIETAHDCADVLGVERAKGISLVPAVVKTNNAKGMYLYKGDGVTKLGRILNTLDYIHTFRYFPVDDNTQVKTYDNKQWLTFKPSMQLYFKTENCQGTAHIYGSGASTPYFVKNQGFNEGGLLKTSDSLSFKAKSALNHEGVCNVYESTTAYQYSTLHPYDDPLCGQAPCIFKEE